MSRSGWEPTEDSENVAFFQLPVRYLVNGVLEFTTLRPQYPVKGVNTIALTDTWKTSRDIVGSNKRKDQLYPLQDLIDALGPDADAIGFGVITNGRIGQATVRSITFDGVEYHFGDPTADPATWALVQSGASKTLKLTWLEQGETIFVTVTGHKQGYSKADSAPSKASGPVK